MSLLEEKVAALSSQLDVKRRALFQSADATLERHRQQLLQSLEQLIAKPVRLPAPLNLPRRG